MIPQCPNPDCVRGKVGNVGCATCKGALCAVCCVHSAGWSCLRSDCPNHEPLASRASSEEVARLRLRLRGADRIADEAEKLIRAGKLDARSLLGDALLDYLDDRDNLSARRALPPSKETGA